MSGRGLLVLALLAALAVAGAILTRQPVDEMPDTAAQPRFLPGLEDRLDAIGRVDVRTPDGRALARIERTASGWVVANRWNHPADLVRLRGTLIGLAEARRLEPKSETPEGHARLGVAAPGHGAGSGLELSLHGLDPAVGVLIGHRASGDIAGTYVRRVGEDRAWLVSGELERHGRIADWLQDELVDIPAIRVHRVRIEAEDGEPVEVVLPSQDAPRFEILDIPAGRKPLSRTLSKSIARVVAELRLSDVRPADGTEPPPRLAVTRFETFDGLQLEFEAFASGREEAAERLVRIRAVTREGAPAEVQARAQALNARFEGWFYRIPDYKFVNLTYTLGQVLAPE